MDHLERVGLQGGEDEEQPIFWRRQGAVLIHAKLAGGPGLPIEAPCRHMGVEGGLEGRDQLRKLVERQAREIQELHGAGLQIGEPYTGHTWCLLSWEAQYTIIGINSTVQQQHQIDVVGPPFGSYSWQHQTGQGYDLQAFVLDWDAQQAHCPQGHTSVKWTPGHDVSGDPVMRIRFDRATCRVCPTRRRAPSAKTPHGN